MKHFENFDKYINVNSANFWARFIKTYTSGVRGSKMNKLTLLWQRRELKKCLTVNIGPPIVTFARKKKKKTAIHLCQNSKYDSIHLKLNLKQKK